MSSPKKVVQFSAETADGILFSGDLWSDGSLSVDKWTIRKTTTAKETHSIRGRSTGTVFRICSRCHETKPIADFYAYTSKYCITCRRSYRFERAGRRDLAQLSDALAPNELTLRALGGSQFVRYMVSGEEPT